MEWIREIPAWAQLRVSRSVLISFFPFGFFYFPCDVVLQSLNNNLSNVFAFQGGSCLDLSSKAILDIA